MEEELRQLVQERGDDLSLGLVLFIVAVAIACFVYIFIQKEKDDLLRHRGVIEMLPTVVSTLGVLGTFAGITLGLYFFDSSPDNLKTDNRSENLKCLCLYCHAHVDEHHLQRLTTGANRFTYEDFIEKYGERSRI